MKLSEFKKSYQYYSESLISKEIASSTEYSSYLTALHENPVCKEWYLKQTIKKAGINYRKYCCLDMAYHMIEGYAYFDKENYDIVIAYDKNKKKFGIPIHDGGNSYVVVNFCPWCGKDISMGLPKFRKNNR